MLFKGIMVDPGRFSENGVVIAREVSSSPQASERIKLNSGASFLNRKAGTAVVLRDSTGSVLGLGFKAVDPVNAHEAEFKAIFLALIWLWKKQFVTE